MLYSIGMGGLNDITEGNAPGCGTQGFSVRFPSRFFSFYVFDMCAHSYFIFGWRLGGEGLGPRNGSWDPRFRLLECYFDPLHTASADVAEHYSWGPGHSDQSLGERRAQTFATVETEEIKWPVPTITITLNLVPLPLRADAYYWTFFLVSFLGLNGLSRTVWTRAIIAKNSNPHFVLSCGTVFLLSF